MNLFEKQHMCVHMCVCVNVAGEDGLQYYNNNNIFTKGDSKYCVELACCFHALMQFNNIRVFFLVIFQKKIQCLSKNLNFKYLFSLFTYRSIRCIFINNLLVLCISHLKSQDTFRLRLFYICTHFSHIKKTQKKVQHIPLRQL